MTSISWGFIYTVPCIKYFLYTPLCERGVFMHFWFPLHGMLIYQYTSYSGLPSYWFSSCLLQFFPPYLYGFHGVFGSFVPSPLWARNRLFLPVAGRVGSTLFLCVRCLVSGNTVVWFEVCRYRCCNSCWIVLSLMTKYLYIFFLYRLSIAAHVCRFFTHCRCLGTCA